MKGRHEKQQRISTGLRICSALLVLLLIPLLTGTLYTWIGIRLISDRALHNRIALNEQTLDEEMRILTEKAEEVGETWNISPALILNRVDRDTLRDMNRQAVDWWMNLAETGKPGEIPQWDGTGLWEDLMGDEAFLAEQDGVLARSSASRIISEMNTTITRLAFPFREELITGGIGALDRRIDLPDLVTGFRKVPPILSACCLLLAGLLFLLLAGRPRLGLRYLGIASGGAGLIALLLLILFRVLNLESMTLESSVRLGQQVAQLEKTVTLDAGLLICLLAGIAAICFLPRQGKRPAWKGR